VSRDHHQTAVKFWDPVHSAFCGSWDSNAGMCECQLALSIWPLFRVADSSATASGSLEEACTLESATMQAAVTSHVRDLPLHHHIRIIRKTTSPPCCWLPRHVFLIMPTTAGCVRRSELPFLPLSTHTRACITVGQAALVITWHHLISDTMLACVSSHVNVQMKERPYA